MDARYKRNKVFDENLIKLVKIYRNLWDRADKNYTNKVLRKKTWVLIGQNLKEDRKLKDLSKKPPKPKIPCRNAM